MTVRQELFRPTAVAAHVASSDAGSRRTIEPERHLVAATVALGLVVLAAAIATLTIRVEETAQGVWTAGPDGSPLQVELPVGALGRLHDGQVVRLDGASTRIAGPPSARSVHGEALAVVALAPVVGGRGTAGRRAVVVLGRQRLAGVLLGRRPPASDG